jgi:serine/threonine-protein kinase SRPK3
VYFWLVFTLIYCRATNEKQRLVALKVVKSSPHYTEAAEDEIRLLDCVVEKSVDNENSPVVRLLDHFYVRGPNGKHVCMVFEVLGANLLKVIKRYDYMGLPIPLVKRIIKQVLEGLHLLHEKCEIIHTDLKPENILLSLSRSEIDTILQNIDLASHELSSSIEGIENIQLSSNAIVSPSISVSRSREYSLSMLDDPCYENLLVKIADLGNGCWVNRHFTNDIQTRQYRCPEVILGLPYDTSADIWSCACLVFELLTGDFLFEPRTGRRYDKNEDHIAQMIELLGKVPKRMIQQGKYSDEIFNRKYELRHIKSLDQWPISSVLQEKYNFSEYESNMISSFLLPMLDYNPKTRANASECLKHTWLQN